MFELLPKQAIPERVIKGMRDKIAEFVTPLRKEPPATLWHYTNAGGLQGIIESGALRATHIAYLNDASEYLHAVRLMLSIAKAEKAANSRKDTLLDDIETFLEVAKPTDSASLFITCFSEAENSLNQWRAYGSGEGGYAIGFDGRLIGLASTSRNGFLFPVIYDAVEQERLIRDIITWALGEYDRQAAVDKTLLLKPQRDLWWQWLFVCAVGVAAILKNSAFSEEREWRFIHLATDYAGMMFRPRSTGLLPFVQLEYGQDRSDKALPFKLPITALWSGPGRATDIALLAGRALLEKYDYPNVRLGTSNIPFRVG